LIKTAQTADLNESAAMMNLTSLVEKLHTKGLDVFVESLAVMHEMQENFAESAIQDMQEEIVLATAEAGSSSARNGNGTDRKYNSKFNLASGRSAYSNYHEHNVKELGDFDHTQGFHFGDHDYTKRPISKAGET
jgi:hypothetical protein